jgi:hypothetical protein
MRYLKTYRVFESSAATEPAAPTLTEDQIGWLNSCTAGSWKLNPSTRLIDVDGDFDCSSKSLTDLKGVKFGEVSGGFFCYDNQLTSLEGAPQSVDGDFSCNNNPVSGETLASIFALMKKGKSYQQALEEHWPEMGNDDRALMYKQMPNLPPEEVRKYQALATVSRIKGYL